MACPSRACPRGGLLAVRLSPPPHRPCQALGLFLYPPALSSAPSIPQNIAKTAGGKFAKFYSGNTEGKDNAENKTPQLEAGVGVGSRSFVRHPLPTAFVLLCPLPIPMSSQGQPILPPKGRNTPPSAPQPLSQAQHEETAPPPSCLLHCGPDSRAVPLPSTSLFCDLGSDLTFRKDPLECSSLQVTLPPKKNSASTLQTSAPGHFKVTDSSAGSGHSVRKAKLREASENVPLPGFQGTPKPCDPPLQPRQDVAPLDLHCRRAPVALLWSPTNVDSLSLWGPDLSPQL